MRYFFTFAVSSLQSASFERKEAVANEPSERHGNIGCGSVIGNRSRDSRDLTFECFLGFKL